MKGLCGIFGKRVKEIGEPMVLIILKNQPANVIVVS